MKQSRIFVLLASFLVLFCATACTRFGEEVGLASDNETEDTGDNAVEDSDNDSASDEDDTDAGTDDEEDTEDSDNATVSDPDTGTVVEPEYMALSLVVPTGTTAVMHKYGETWDTECKVGVDDDPSDFRCIIEGIELGLYHYNGTIKINYNIPEGLCKYFEVRPYYFYQFIAGYGPSSYTLTTTNDVPVLSNVSNRTSGVSATLDGDGNVVCTADYTDNASANPVNCCEGSYVATERVIDTSDNSDTTTVSTGEWGGAISACLAGPALDTQDLDSNGYPRSTLYVMEGIGLNRDYEIESPMSHEHSTNLHIANYFDISASFDADGVFIWSTAPIAIQGAAVQANPWYEFACLDEGDDYIHRIRVMARSWSTEEQYELGASGSYNLGDDGAEEAFFAQQPLLDLYGWFVADDWNLMTQYPGLGL